MRGAFVSTRPVSLSCLVRLAAILSLTACASQATAPVTKPQRPPTPTSITQKEPGGDAEDPHRAALERLLREPWGARNDKLDQIHAPMPDWENWRRVRYWGFEHLAGFRYGKTYHAVGVARVQELPPGTPARSETCLRAVEAWVRPQLQGFDVKLEPIGVKLVRWRDQPLEIHTVDGWVSWGIDNADFSAAWTAYPAYPGACMVYGIAVPWRDQKALAQAVRDRFVTEGFLLFDARTETIPKPAPPGPANPPATSSTP
jgi:hypothetical protein